MAASVSKAKQEANLRRQRILELNRELAKKIAAKGNRLKVIRATKVL